MENNSKISEPAEHQDDLPKLEQPNILWSKTNVYIVQELLGSGTFGNVVKGVINGTNEKVAIKILKDTPYVAEHAEEEVDILCQLSKEQPDDFNLVKHYDHFQHNNNICIVFEMLDISLSDFIKKCNCRPLPVKHIRPIVQQVGSALAKLKSLGIIHTDLKPENIMLVDTSKHPFKVKVIDFGCAIHTSKAQCSRYIQTRYYRSPEIILGLPFWEAIDMWSLGCIMAELFTGHPLYPGASEYDQIRYITETQGLPPENMLDRGTKTEFYFRIDWDSDDVLWSLKSKIRYEFDSGIRPIESRKYVFSSLDDMRKVILPSKLESSDTLVEMGDVGQFIDLMKEMLAIDPRKRITPTEFLSHPFITMAHLQHFTRSSSVNPCFQAMEINKEQHENAITLANQMGVQNEISSQTEAEPQGACESAPPAQIEIQDQHAQDEPLQKKSNEAEENCEVVMEDVGPNTQERPAQSKTETSDENEIEILSELDDGDREEKEGKKKRKRGSCLRRVLRALCCCIPRKPKKVKVNTPESSDVVIYQVHGLHNSTTESSTESEAATSTHSSLPSERSGGLLRKCVNSVSRMRMKKQKTSSETSNIQSFHQ
ncbi:Homeodomain-interacting kinase 2 [Pelobates cultripes]|uniref:Homeodomain-interacting kinase 2, partial n=1 Tax=Pelobates cultripes TaxID=61616 RepID=A0AAD1T6U9_PELCU|nr:Homeodomain-interacting kinase 2 [Pelobates cultripes]